MHVLTPAQSAAYLARIGASGLWPDTREELAEIHRRHLESVPFENLDILTGRPISFDPAALYAKVVERRRGGFCYELNGLFSALLRSAGCAVELVEARFLEADETLSPRFDHLSLLVTLPDEEHTLFADVGCGKLSPTVPLELREQPGTLASGEHGWQLVGEPEQLTFGEEPRALADFADRCAFHEHHADSYFRRGLVCTRRTAEGWIALSESAFTELAGGVRTEAPVERSAVPALLAERFGLRSVCELQAWLKNAPSR